MTYYLLSRNYEKELSFFEKKTKKQKPTISVLSKILSRNDDIGKYMWLIRFSECFNYQQQINYLILFVIFMFKVVQALWQ